MIRTVTAGALVLLATLTQAGHGVAIRDAWIGFLPGDRPMGGFFVLDNRSGREQTVVSVSSTAFEDVSMHRTIDQGDAVTMKPVASLSIPSPGQVEFAPGGYHLMLMGPQRPLQMGDQVPVQLRFESGEVATAQFSIKPLWQE
uniref:copper chaperone PCu(A)C n=1 Tax=Marinobacterium profundum TaxID=1714300 RepID=UPI00082AF274|nr:copper chaperone PCu(A)C [Marinobacterium profundum]